MIKKIHNSKNMKHFYYSIYYGVITALLYFNNAYGDMNLWQDKVDDSLKWNDSSDLPSIIEDIVYYLVWLLFFCAVIYWLYGWFMILTSGGDEERAKKWRKIIIFMIIGIIVMFLAWTLVSWVMDVMTDEIND